MKFFTKFIIFYLICLFLTPAVIQTEIKDNSKVILNSSRYLYNKNILDKTPKQRATVGVIFIYKNPTNHKSYVFLGRERIDSGESKAGVWCDLGGSTEKGNFYENLAREVQEESMEQILLNEYKEDVYEKGYIFYNVNPKNNREIVYLVFQAEDELVFKLSALADKRSKLKDNDYPREYLEKDNFEWIDLKDLSEKINSSKSSSDHLLLKLENDNGIEKEYLLRNYFIKDFLLNIEIQTLLKKL